MVCTKGNSQSIDIINGGKKKKKTESAAASLLLCAGYKRKEKKSVTIAIGLELILSGHVALADLSCEPFQETSLENGRTNQITLPR
jgi:hypothetical protein